MGTFTRRQFVAAAGTTAAFGLSSSLSIAQTAAKLRCFWWGNPDRDKRTKTLLDTYGQKNNLQIAAETVGWGDYWTKLATQVAGGNAPDLIQMDYRYLFAATGQAVAPHRFHCERSQRRQGGWQALRRQPGLQLQGHGV